MSDAIANAFIQRVQAVRVGQKTLAEKYPTKLTRKDLEVRYLPSGIPGLDIATGGGFPLGHFTEIFGVNSWGKTQTALIGAANTIKHGGGFVYVFMETGHVDVDWAAQLGVIFIGPDQNAMYHTPSNGSEAGDLVFDYILSSKETGLRAIVLDSLATMLSAAEAAKMPSDNARVGGNSQLLTQFFNRMGPLLRDHGQDVAFIGINQARQNMDKYGPGFYAPGGEAKDHAASIRIEMRPPDFKHYGDLGRVFNGRIVKNKTATMLKDEFEYDVFYKDADGADAVIYAPARHLLKHGTEYGIFTNKSGEVYTGAGEVNFNGQLLGRKKEDAVNAIAADEGLQDAIYLAFTAALERSYQDANDE